MAYRIPTIAELTTAHLARLESQLGQTSPTNDKAFLRVLAGIESGLDIGHYKYAADAVLQTLALTATGEGLDLIGNNNECPRKAAVAAVVIAILPATTGTVIPLGWEFVSDDSGLRYKTVAEITASGNIAILSLKCAVVGTDGNLDVGATLSISSQIAGVTTVATVTVATTTGADQESDSDYRPRVIFAERAITGGGNATDHKRWAEAVTGVRRAFSYSGSPGFASSFPGERTVYIESVTTIDADGLAPLSLLDDVREALNTDPITGKSRMMLGLTDSTLYVNSIIRTPIFVEISNLVVASDKEAALKSNIATGLDLYFRNIAPYVDGVDIPQERMDTITALSLADIVQDILFSYGATANTVTFGIVVGVGIPIYFIDPGELIKLGAVYYV